MDVVSYRILDVLARTLGEALSIRSLARRIAAVHGTGAYPNVHAAVQRLADEGFVRLTPSGRAHTVHPDIRRARDALAQRDLERLRQLLDQHPRFRAPLEGLHDLLFDHQAAGLLMDPARGLQANRIGLIILSKQGPADLLRRLAEWGRRHQVPVDAAPLEPEQFASLAGSPQWNPVPDGVRGGIPFHHPQAVWHALQGVRHWPEPVPPPTLDETLGALGALGYRELGAPAGERGIRVEEAATRLLEDGKPRQAAAAAVVLAKNPPIPGLLHHQALRRGVAPQTLSLLRVARPDDPTIALLEASGVVQARLDEAHITSTLAKHA